MGREATGHGTRGAGSGLRRSVSQADGHGRYMSKRAVVFPLWLAFFFLMVVMEDVWYDCRMCFCTRLLSARRTGGGQGRVSRRIRTLSVPSVCISSRNGLLPFESPLPSPLSPPPPPRSSPCSRRKRSNIK
ncbi:hypothetical protein LX36DRAFT_445174 [Colletotrichum falcatum]|nr:hypothetical protein LX36DRAFT_445174 [Colletotrichum falcatum]